MPSFQKLLYPTDFSDLANYASEYARSLAEVFGAELHVLHVVDEAYQYWTAMGPHSLPVGPPPEELIANARQHMTAWKDDLFAGASFPVVTEVVGGRPFMEIIRYAREKSIDLIVIGTHGRTGLSHMLLGSVAERVVRKAPCPVLSVRHPGHHFKMP